MKKGQINISDKDSEKLGYLGDTRTNEQKWQKLWKTKIMRGQTNKSDTDYEKLEYLEDRWTKMTRIIKTRILRGQKNKKGHVLIIRKGRGLNHYR